MAEPALSYGVLGFAAALYSSTPRLAETALTWGDRAARLPRYTMHSGSTDEAGAVRDTWLTDSSTSIKLKLHEGEAEDK